VILVKEGANPLRETKHYTSQIIYEASKAFLASGSIPPCVTLSTLEACAEADSVSAFRTCFHRFLGILNLSLIPRILAHANFLSFSVAKGFKNQSTLIAAFKPKQQSP